ncbi:hypothetical protein [Streptomyces sp. NBC_00079]|uniref:hypothetical protein n=1 Tax=Streptomyces sp. NBC_00079 TaxID=2975644 RepID=UPI0032518F0D
METETTFLVPMSTTFLLNTLACVLWPVWGFFVVDVLRVALDAAREATWPAVRPGGPVHALAAVLVGTIVVSLLANRSAPSGMTIPVRARADQFPVATANGAGLGPTLDVSERLTQPLFGHVSADQRSTPRTVTVRPPHYGIHDSLWRVADRTLGDGGRWPEIYALNCGRPQPDGDALTNPDLIRPGWILRLPDGASPSVPDHHAPGAPRTPKPSPSASPSPSPSAGSPSPPSASPSSSGEPSSSAPWVSSHGPRPHEPDGHGEPGISLPTGAYVGLGLAALITAALATVRLRRRVRYQPGSGRREDLTIAPVVRALRMAHDQATRGPDDGADDEDTTPDTSSPVPEVTLRTEAEQLAKSLTPPEGRVIGTKEGQALAWELARTRGLGLVGPGALDAVRALLIAAVAEQHRPTTRRVDVVVPASDARMLLGEDATERRSPSRLQVVDDLDAALDILEAELLTRTRNATEDEPTPTAGSTGAGELVLLASPTPQTERRLQSVLDNGSSLGLAGVLVGQWRPGGTVRVRSDGTVTATSPSLKDPLTGARLFTLPVTDTRALLDLLCDSRTATPAESRSGRETGTHRPHADLDDLEPVEFNGAHPEADREARPQAHPVRHGSRPAAGVRTSEVEQPQDRSLRLAVLGPVHLTHHRSDSGEDLDITDSLAPKQREILAYLALHRDGARREALTAAIWPDAPSERPYNSFHATLSQLRRALRTATDDDVNDLVVHHDVHYALDPDQVVVDFWDLQNALHDGRAAESDQYRQTALEQGIELFTGDLAEDVTSEWLEAPREALRRDVLDALGTLIRSRIRTEPQRALTLLERARTLDRYNEAIYRDIGRIQARLGENTEVSRTLSLLSATLAEVDEEPARETMALFEFLQRHGPAESRSRGRTAS